MHPQFLILTIRTSENRRDLQSHRVSTCVTSSVYTNQRTEKMVPAWDSFNGWYQVGLLTVTTPFCQKSQEHHGTNSKSRLGPTFSISEKLAQVNANVGRHRIYISSLEICVSLPGGKTGPMLSCTDTSIPDVLQDRCASCFSFTETCIKRSCRKHCNPRHFPRGPVTKLQCAVTGADFSNR